MENNEVQNQIQTKNESEEGQLQTQAREEEDFENATEEGPQNRNENATQHMSDVAKYVQELLNIKDGGGIGEQVRVVAQEQNQSQIQIQEQLNKLDSKGKFARFLTGTDFGAVKNLKVELTQNQVRVMRLEQLKNQLSNQDDIQAVQQTIQALIQQNTSLQERITTEEQTKSLFGWLIKLISK